YPASETGEMIWYIMAGICGLATISYWQMIRKVTVFDKNKSLCWVGKSRYKPTGRTMPLQDIYAIQFLREECESTSGKGSGQKYSAYEINLVSADGSRMNALDIGKKNKAREFLGEIRDFTGAQVWDAEKAVL
ncbi:MAG: hypothetical protein ACOCVG_04225, partial [Verrucomicrobiota bacterium]